MARHQLHLGSGFDAAWQHVAMPWFRSAANDALKSNAPFAVLVPSPSHASLLKQKLLAASIPLAAVRFWTPREAREFLAARISPPPRVAVREHMHLLLSIIASAAGDSPVARAIARDPTRLLRTLDALAVAGEKMPDELPSEAKTIAKEFHKRLDQLGWTMVQHLDAKLVETKSPTSIASLLILGFDGIHWELWPLLRAAVRASQNTDIVLTQPRFKAEQIDQLWIGTWEQNYGVSELLPDAAPRGPFAPLADKMENPQGDIAGKLRNVDVLIGRNLREQAEAIVARCVAWLAEGNVDRLGILVPGADALAREISARLIERGIVHFDAIGHGAAPDDESQRWKAWLELQREQKLGPLLKVTRASCPQLERAFGEVMVDDLAVITAWLRDSTNKENRDAAEMLAQLPLLPSSASLAAFIEQTRAAIRDAGWKETLARFDQQAEAIAQLRDEKISRGLYLDWLTAVTAAASRQRDPRTSNQFAVVHLLPYSQAEGQPWSHLLLAGLNEGHWPPSFEQPGFLNETAIAAINKTALATGDQGEGHFTIKSYRALLLGPAERRALARRQFYNLVEAAGVSLAITAAMEDDEESRGIGPGDFLSHLYFTQTNEPLTESRASQIQAATLRWIEREGDAAPPSPDIEKTQIAHEARRLPGAFGEYEFAMRSPPDGELAIACKEWETALTNPATVFMSHLLGVESEGDFLEGDRWPLTTGTWVHAWIRDAIGRCDEELLVRRADAATLIAQSRTSALKTRTAVERAFAAAHRPLPDWWQSNWANAQWVAGELAERVGEIADWPWAKTEWTLPKPTDVRIGDATLRLRGRMDLVLSPDEVFVRGSRLWLFDFKTGSDKPLKPKDLLKKFAKGEGGLQLALYALALRAIGASEVAITLLTPESIAAPQLTATDIEVFADFWRGLIRMQDSGIFGNRGELRSEFGHTAEMPIATVAVSPDLLEEKWALSHPSLVAGEP